MGTTNQDAVKIVRRALLTGKMVQVRTYTGGGIVTVGPYHCACRSADKTCAAFVYGDKGIQRNLLRYEGALECISDPSTVAAFVVRVCGRRVASQIKRAFGW